MIVREINERGLSIIKECEGLRLEAYVCPAGKLTIGYGHTLGVKEGDKITQEQAEQFLKDDVKSACLRLEHLEDVESIRLNDNQFSALTSFIYNLGIYKFQTSTMMKYLIIGDNNAAADEFDRWVFSKNKILPGLVKRRAMEKELFLS